MTSNPNAGRAPGAGEAAYHAKGAGTPLWKVAAR